MSLTHSFSVAVATALESERKAVILNNFAFWHKVNITKPDHCLPYVEPAEPKNPKKPKNPEKTKPKPRRDPDPDVGTVFVWSYNTLADFGKIWPYMTEREIYFALQSLTADGYLKTGTFNQQARDRTKWYALTQKACDLLGIIFSHFTKPLNASDKTVKCNLQNGQMDLTKVLNPFDKSVRALPDSIPSNIPLENTHTGDASAPQVSEGNDELAVGEKKGNAPPGSAAPPRSRPTHPGYVTSRDAEALNVPFSVWFPLYDYNAARASAMAAWIDLTDDERLRAMEHTPNFVRSRQQKEFRGYAVNYLLKKQFNDEIVYRDATNNAKNGRDTAAAGAGRRSRSAVDYDYDD